MDNVVHPVSQGWTEPAERPPPLRPIKWCEFRPACEFLSSGEIDGMPLCHQHHGFVSAALLEEEQRLG